VARTPGVDGVTAERGGAKARNVHVPLRRHLQPGIYASTFNAPPTPLHTSPHYTVVLRCWNCGAAAAVGINGRNTRTTVEIEQGTLAEPLQPLANSTPPLPLPASPLSVAHAGQFLPLLAQTAGSHYLPSGFLAHAWHPPSCHPFWTELNSVALRTMSWMWLARTRTPPPGRQFKHSPLSTQHITSSWVRPPSHSWIVLPALTYSLPRNIPNYIATYPCYFSSHLRDAIPVDNISHYGAGRHATRARALSPFLRVLYLPTYVAPLVCHDILRGSTKRLGDISTLFACGELFAYTLTLRLVAAVVSRDGYLPTTTTTRFLTPYVTKVALRYACLTRLPQFIPCYTRSHFYI